MSILVVGSVAFDSIKTPFGEVEEVIGGSATYFSLAASYFSEVSVVAVVGEDFSERHLDLFRLKNIDTRGMKRARGRTFRWKGAYGYDLNEAETLETQLNVFANFKPKIPEDYRQKPFVFLGNIDPDLQRDVLRQVQCPRLVACDTMNYWIHHKLASLQRTLGLVDILIINDAEARQLTAEPNLIKAARKIRDLGPKILVIKRGEYGAVLVSGDCIFTAPAYPLEDVSDPTGAGDSFAGGFVGYLASAGDLSESYLKRAIVFGSVMASFNVEEFGIRRLSSLTFPQIVERFQAFKALTHFEDLNVQAARV
ncbi:MAG: sugar kinase [Acidobacteria bacterium]|nr:sugar kinase [Acidobacteriota bacterium]